MKRILCVTLALLLLAGCSVPEPAPIPKPEGSYTQDIYELTFSVERVSGGSTRDWDFTYSHNDENIASGHRVLLSKEVFTFLFPPRSRVLINSLLLVFAQYGSYSFLERKLIIDQGL